MRVIIALDSFKGNMNAPLVCRAIEAGILRVDKKAKVVKIPLADGGEGTASAITEAAAYTKSSTENSKTPNKANLKSNR